MDLTKEKVLGSESGDPHCQVGGVPVLFSELNSCLMLFLFCLNQDFLSEDII